jgi:hypothetical protein
MSRSYRQLGLSMSFLGFVLCATSLPGEANPWALLALACGTIVCSLMIYQFGTRLFRPFQAARRTARLSEKATNHLRSLRTASWSAGLVLLAANVIRHFLFHQRDSDASLAVYLFLWLIPDCLADLVGDSPSRPKRLKHFTWADAKPLHSDHWSQPHQS